MSQEKCKWYQVCPIKRFYQQKRIAKYWVDYYCCGNWQKCRRYFLEENNIPHPDNMLPDGSIDKTLED